MQTKIQRNIYPMPEAIDGQRWAVADGAPRVDLTKRTLFAPLGADDCDRFLRAHELAHARITPRTRPETVCKREEITITALQVCEDARVHTFLRRRRIPTTGALTDDEAVAMVRRAFGRVRDLAALMIGTVGTDDYQRVRDAAIAEADARGFADRWPEFEAGVDAVFQAVSRGPEKRTHLHPAETTRGFKTRTIPAARLFDQLFPERESAEDEELRKMLLTSARVAAARPGDGRWGVLKPVERAPLPQMRRPDRRGIRRRFVDEGAIPTAVHRLTTDGRIFTRPRRRVAGGTVLVDFSGSMSLDAATLRAIIEAAPAARVAVYSGQGKGGRLVIVADRGRCADDRGLEAARHGGGNVVDGPALRWLAGQPEPRVWVSDGMVTGEHDHMHGNLMHEAVATCKRGRIRRVDDAEGAVGAMAR